MRTKNCTAQKTAFTLIEVLIVIAIVSILVTISIVGLSTYSTHVNDGAAVRTVTGALIEAHARTLSADGATEYGVKFSSSSVTIFPGTVYVAGHADNDVRALSKAEITNISLTGGDTEVVFERLRGNASATGTITVTQTKDTALSRTVTIYGTGLSEVN